jgi:phosphoheptose isomerase
MQPVLAQLLARHPELVNCGPSILAAYELLAHCFWNGGKLLVCGNGGSAADSEHVVGELMKGFKSRRPIPAKLRAQLVERYGAHGGYLADNLQGALPALSLISHTALAAAFAGEVAPDLVFAQQVYAYGRQGDAILGLSTSGDSPNVLYAFQVGRELGLHTVCLTGLDGSRMEQVCDVTVCVPGAKPVEVQELHLPVYHALCEMLEQTFFP